MCASLLTGQRVTVSGRPASRVCVGAESQSHPETRQVSSFTRVGGHG